MNESSRRIQWPAATKAMQYHVRRYKSVDTPQTIGTVTVLLWRSLMRKQPAECAGKRPAVRCTCRPLAARLGYIVGGEPASAGDASDRPLSDMYATDNW